MRLLKKTKSAILVNPKVEKKQELFADEASAYYTEAILGGKVTVDMLLEDTSSTAGGPHSPQGEGSVAGYYDPRANKIVVNPKAAKRQELVLIHELDHALRAFRGNDGKVHYLVYKDADKRLSDETWSAIQQEYADQDIEVSREELLADEASAYYTEAILGGKGTVDLLLGKEPSLAKKILNFFTGAARAYSKDAKLAKEARAHYRKFKKLFDSFAEFNKGRNAETAVERETVGTGVPDGTSSVVDTTQEKSVRQSKNIEAKLEEYKKPITLADIQPLRSMPDKNVNDFSSDEIASTGKWAYKFYRELGTKSPFFRAWFGDWRAYDKSQIKVVSVPTIDISQARLKSGNYKIDDTGWEVYAGKTLNDDTRHHTGGQRVNVKSLSAIDSILENAVLLDTLVSSPNTNKKSPNTAFLHKLYTLVEYDRKMYIAKITVEEFYNETVNDATRRAYNLKAIKIEPAGGQLGINSSSSVPVTDSIYSISDLFDFVKTFDKEFKPKSVNPALLNEDGTPKVFYHGTRSQFTTFELQDKPKFGRALGDGFYFTPDYDKAFKFANGLFSKGQDRGGVIMPVYLRMENPYVIEKDADRTKWAKEYNAGKYDGIIDLKNDTYYVEKPGQIKSATDNIGTFDGENKDIRFSKDITPKVAEESGIEKSIGKLSEGRIESVAGRDAKAGARRAARKKCSRSTFTLLDKPKNI